MNYVILDRNFSYTLVHKAHESHTNSLTDTMDRHVLYLLDIYSSRLVQTLLMSLPRSFSSLLNPLVPPYLASKLGAAIASPLLSSTAQDLTPVPFQTPHPHSHQGKFQRSGRG